MHTLLARVGVRLLDFRPYALRTSEAVKDVALQEAVAQRRPIRYLQSAQTDKEALARRLLAEQLVDRGLICAFRTVEPCMSFEYPRSPEPAERGLRLRPRKCLHIYKYRAPSASWTNRSRGHLRCARHDPRTSRWNGRRVNRATRRLSNLVAQSSSTAGGSGG
jgi:hypothetical protein